MGNKWLRIGARRTGARVVASRASDLADGAVGHCNGGPHGVRRDAVNYDRQCGVGVRGRRGKSGQKGAANRCTCGRAARPHAADGCGAPAAARSVRAKDEINVSRHRGTDTQTNSKQLRNTQNTQKSTDTQQHADPYRVTQTNTDQHRSTQVKAKAQTTTGGRKINATAAATDRRINSTTRCV